VKRMLGIAMVGLGGAGVLWGGFCLLTGASAARIDINYEYSIAPMPAGLAGAALLVFGLVFARE